MFCAATLMPAAEPNEPATSFVASWPDFQPSTVVWLSATVEPKTLVFTAIAPSETLLSTEASPPPLAATPSLNASALL